jgi:hypothetical protein
MKYFLLLILTFSFWPAFTQPRVIHILVALCDNEHQGIVPVPAKIGNGADPSNNLYWGCGYGLKTFFKKQTDWKLVKQIGNPEKDILERLVFKNTTANVYLVADAYNGAAIKNTTIDLLDYAAGLHKKTVKLDSVIINCGGAADLIGYIGHDGLMDFELESYPAKADTKTRQVIILACASKNYFARHIYKTGAQPLLWTTQLMCPEAYTMHAAIKSWVNNEPATSTREVAAATYNQYQKCGLKGARNLLVTGF